MPQKQNYSLKDLLAGAKDTYEAVSKKVKSLVKDKKKKKKKKKKRVDIYSRGKVRSRAMRDSGDYSVKNTVKYD